MAEIVGVGSASNSLFINSNAFVGIGKSNAAYALDVVGDVNFSGTLRFNGAPYQGSQWSTSNNGTITYASNVYIGGSLTVAGTNALQSAIIQNTLIDSSNLVINNAGSGPALSVTQTAPTAQPLAQFLAGAGTTPALYIASNAFVGIGTNTPAAALDVSGNLNISGGITGASNIGMFRDRIVNGDMRLDQSATASVPAVIGSMTAPAAASNPALDKWQAATGPSSGALVAQQVALPTADQQALSGAFNKAVQLSPVPMNGLTTYIPFENGSVADVMNNATSAGTTGTLSSVLSASTYKVGTASLNLTANTSQGSTTAASASAYYSTTATTILNTFAFWFNPSAPASQNQVMFQLGSGLDSGASTGYAVSFYVNGTTYIQTNFVTTAGNILTTVTTPTMVAGTWYHYAVTIAAGGYMNAYFNGALVGTSASAVSASATYQCDNSTAITNLRLGCMVSGLYSYKGYIDDVRIYNRVLSAAEVAALANNLGVPQIPPTSNLTTQLTFDHTTADAQGTLTSPTMTAGTLAYNTTLQKVGNACLDLSASASTLLKYNIPGVSSPSTISFWVNPTSIATSYQAVVSIGSTSNYGYLLQMNLGTIYGVITVNSTQYAIPSGGTFAAGTWTHVCTTQVTGGSCILYVNGVQVSSVALGSGAFTDNVGTAMTTLLFGAQLYNNNSPFKGYIDDFRIYNTALSAAQIAALYQYSPTNAIQPTTQLTFDSTTADAQGTLAAPTVSGTVAYNTSMQRIGSACLDMTANVASTNGSPNSGTLNCGLTYPLSSMTLPFTISLWLYTSATSGLLQMLFAITTASDVPLQFYIDTSGVVTVGFWLGGVNYPITGGAMPLNKWTHLAFTITNTNAYLYMNGNLSNSITTGAGQLTPTPTQFCIGHQLSSWRFKGLMDDLRIYNTALSAAQVANLYQYSSTNASYNYNASYLMYQQPIDAPNIADLAWGTSNAAPVTVSAYIKNNSATSNAQQFALSLQNSAANRSYIYATPSLPANSWSKVSFTVPGDSNTTAANTGLTLGLSLGAGNAYNLASQGAVSTSGATLSTTGAYTVCSYTTVGTNSGSFTVAAPCYVDFLIVGGGGGGAYDRAAGGGAGGCIYGQNVQLAAGTYNVTVGAGGTGVTTNADASGGNGGNSSFSVWTAYGGGGAGGYNVSGANGGCGGGGSGQSAAAGGAATVGGQGFAGGAGKATPQFASGGGGGIGGVGNPATTAGGGDGGPGLAFSISGTLTYYGGGGGGSPNYGGSYTYAGKGGIGGGGNAGQSAGAAGANGTPNTGGGGGGGANISPANGGNGGSGIVIIRYITNAKNSTTLTSSWNNNLCLTSNIQVFGQSSSNFLSSLGNSLLLTGVQLEKGSTTTPYEFRPYAIENLLATTSTLNSMVVPKNTPAFICSFTTGSGGNTPAMLRNPQNLTISYSTTGTYILTLPTGLVLPANPVVTCNLNSAWNQSTTYGWVYASASSGASSFTVYTIGGVSTFNTANVTVSVTLE